MENKNLQETYDFLAKMQESRWEDKDVCDCDQRCSKCGKRKREREEFQPFQPYINPWPNPYTPVSPYPHWYTPVYCQDTTGGFLG